ncbi:unnamed protein product, partial [marine sediment metagenome]
LAQDMAYGGARAKPSAAAKDDTGYILRTFTIQAVEDRLF